MFTPATGASLLTTKAMHSMCSLQRRILRVFASNITERAYLKEPFNEFNQCQNTWSILDLIMSFNNKTSCEDITEKDLQRFRALLQDCVELYENGLLTDSCVEPSNCKVEVPDKCLANDIVKTVFHAVTPNDFVTEVKQRTFNLKSTMMFMNIYYHDQWDFYMEIFDKKVVTDGTTTIVAMEFFLKYDLFGDYLQSDAIYLALGTGMAILIIVLYTKSLFVTIMTILNIGMSVVIAYFVYKVVFQLPFTPFVNILALVLLIGIGADDTFVFIDIWNKAKAELPNSKDRTAVMHETLRHAAVTMFVTSFTTGSALYANLISSIVAIRCFAVFSGTAIMANFILTITWLPVVVVIDDWCEEKCCGWRLKILDRIGCCWKPLVTKFNDFFESYLPVLIFKLRYLWIVVFVLLGAAGAYLVFYWPKLKLPTSKNFQVFYSGHPLEKYDLLFRSKYGFEQDEVDVMPYIVVFGAIATDGRSTWDPDERGNKVVVFDETFDISEPDSQDWLMTFCRDLRTQPFIDNRKNDSYCFMDLIKDHMEQPCQSISHFIPDECCGRKHTEFPYSKTDFQFCVPIICYVFVDCSGRSDSFSFSVNYGPLFKGENNSIVALAIVATSTSEETPDYEVTHEYFSAANPWTSEQIRDAPHGMRGGWFVAKGWYQLGFYALQTGLATGAAESMGISLGIGALVLFLTTRNILISLYAIASVAGTVFVTIGALVLLGWQLNITESVILSIAVGLSVDFTIHYGVAYRIAPVTDRKGRSEFALKTLGSAITVAALSTLCAGAIMMPASVLSYSQLGMFMVLVMSISWMYANFFFLSLCRTIGPPRNIAQITLPSCCCGDSQDALDVNFYIHDDSTQTRNSNSIQSPDSDNLLEHVEMNDPSTMQFNSLSLVL